MRDHGHVKQFFIGNREIRVTPSLVLDGSCLMLSGCGLKHLMNETPAASVPCTTVHLWDNAIDDDGFASLVESPISKHIQVLWMGHNQMTGEALHFLARRLCSGAFEDIRDLFIDDNHIDDSGVNALAVACCDNGYMPQLARLGLHTNRITCDGASTIGKVLLSNTWPHLSTLWLHNNQIKTLGPLSAAMESRTSRLRVTLHANPIAEQTLSM